MQKVQYDKQIWTTLLSADPGEYLIAGGPMPRMVERCLRHHNYKCRLYPNVACSIHSRVIYFEWNIQLRQRVDCCGSKGAGLWVCARANIKYVFVCIRWPFFPFPFHNVVLLCSRYCCKLSLFHDKLISVLVLRLQLLGVWHTQSRSTSLNIYPCGPAPRVISPMKTLFMANKKSKKPAKPKKKKSELPNRPNGSQGSQHNDFLETGKGDKVSKNCVIHPCL